MDLTTYRSLLRDSRARRLLAGLAVSSLGDGMSIVTSTPLGIALGGPLVSVLGGASTLVASGLATVLLAAVSLLLWPREPASSRHEHLGEAAAEAGTLP